MMLRQVAVGQKFEFADKNAPIQWVGANGLKMLDKGCRISECSDVGVFPATGTFKYLGFVTTGICPVILCMMDGQRLFAIPSTFDRDVIVIF